MAQPRRRATERRIPNNGFDENETEMLRGLNQAVFGYRDDPGLIADVKEVKGDVKRVLYAFITGMISIVVVLIGAIAAHVV